MTDDRIPSIRPMTPADWPRVEEIYAQGIATGDATLQTETPDREEWDASHLDDARLVAEEDGRVLGWAALSPVSGRCVYDGVAEGERLRGRGRPGRRVAERGADGAAQRHGGRPGSRGRLTERLRGNARARGPTGGYVSH